MYKNSGLCVLGSFCLYNIKATPSKEISWNKKYIVALLFRTTSNRILKPRDFNLGTLFKRISNNSRLRSCVINSLLKMKNLHLPLPGINSKRMSFSSFFEFLQKKGRKKSESRSEMFGLLNDTYTDKYRNQAERNAGRLTCRFTELRLGRGNIP